MAEQSDRIPQKASPQTFKVFAGLPERHELPDIDVIL
jgi:hypothetical protein